MLAALVFLSIHASKKCVVRAEKFCNKWQFLIAEARLFEYSETDLAWHGRLMCTCQYVTLATIVSLITLYVT